MSWLPPEPPAEPTAGRPWRPASLQEIDVDELLYVVVEEILEGSANLLASEWPALDDDGRLRFGTEPPFEATMDSEVLERFLAQHRLPLELRERRLRVGDTFAVRATRDLRASPLTSEERLKPQEWIRPPVYDITADARDVAKVAFYGAVTPTLDPIEVDRLEEIVEPGPAATPAVRPGRRLPVRWLTATAVVLVAGVATGIAVGEVTGGDTTTVTAANSTVTAVSTVSVPTTETETETETQTETVTETVTTEAAPKPDLTVSLPADGVRVSSCPGPNCITTVSFEVANISPQADVTQPFVVSIRSTAPNPDTGVVTQTITETVEQLGADSTLPIRSELPAGASCTTSDCTITIEVDSSGVISESNEDNNTATGSPQSPVD